MLGLSLNMSSEKHLVALACQFQERYGSQQCSNCQCSLAKYMPGLCYQLWLARRTNKVWV